MYHPTSATGALVHAPVFGPTLRLLITTLNALPVQPLSEKACPPAGHETAQVTVDEGPQRLQYRATLGSCGVVQVTFAGVPQPGLEVDDALRTLLRRAAASPPPAPPVGTLEAALRPLAHSPRAATRQANAALLLIHLPEAVQDSGSATVPPDDVFTLGTPSVVERQTGWTAAMTPNDLMDYEGAHPPPGFTASDSGSGDGKSTQGFRTAANDHVILRVTVSAKGSGSEVLVNAQVFWTPPKPLAEVIAAGVTTATLRYTAPNLPGAKPGATTKLTLRGTALARVVRAINALRTRTLDVITGCGYPTSEVATLQVHNHGELVVFTIALTGCSLVVVTSGKVKEPTLNDSDTLNAVLRAAVRRAGEPRPQGIRRLPGRALSPA